MDMYTLLCLKWIVDKDLHTAHGALLNVLWWPGWKGVWRRMDTCVCMAGSLCCSPEIVTRLFVNWLCPSTK